MAPALEDWLLVDERALGLLRVLYRLPNDGMLQSELLSALDGLSGLRQVIETSMNRDVFAVGLVRTLDEARDLRARIQDLAPGRSVAMDLLETESYRAAPATWLALARRELADPQDAESHGPTG